MRAVLDTNVLLSGIAHPASVPGKLIAPWKRLALEGVPSSLILDSCRLSPRCSTWVGTPGRKKGRLRAIRTPPVWLGRGEYRRKGI
jgi:hypothetical protein